MKQVESAGVPARELALICIKCGADYAEAFSRAHQPVVFTRPPTVRATVGFQLDSNRCLDRFSQSTFFLVISCSRSSLACISLSPCSTSHFSQSG